MASDYDVVIIGGGPGGYVCGIRCGQLGLKTLVVERDKLGGVCLNVGCIPSKALIHASKLAHKAQNGAHMGIVAKDVTVDLPTLIGWKDGIVGGLTKGVGTLLKANKTALRYGDARLAGPGQVAITDAEGKTETVRATNIVLATGSRPIEIPTLPFDGETIIDSTGALAPASLPGHLAVIGGGVIGMELGEVYARLGCKVTVIEALDRVLAVFDKDVVRPLQMKHRKLGIDHMVSTRVTGATVSPAGTGGTAGKDGKAGKGVKASKGAKASTVTLSYEDAKGAGELVVDRVLVAVGRRPNTGELGLETVGLQPDARGFLAVDAQQRTAAAGVWAIGDIVPGPMLAHKASKEGEICAEAMAGKPAAMDVAAIPNVVYTDPEIATVGPTLQELKDSGRALKIGKFPFGALGRAMTADATEGFARVIGDAETGQVLAVQVVGAEASELIAEAGFALEMSADLEDIALTVHAHPTMAESLMEAAKAALGEAIHSINR